MAKKLGSIFVLVVLLSSVLATTAFAVYRSGSSDGEKVPFMWGVHYEGRHQSGSDLVEDTIQVVGKLKVSGVLADSCTDSHPGSTAACNTTKDYLNPFYSGRAESSHYFHKSGYVDSNFNTAKDF